MASTNHPDQLDAALRRPGRFDVHVAFDYAVHSQAVDLFKHFYPLSWINHVLPANTDEESTEKSSPYEFKNQDDIDRGAQQFADSIMNKEIKVSVATIQAFLLLYKKDPVMALDKVDEWADAMKVEQFSGPQGLVVEEGKTDVLKPEMEGPGADSKVGEKSQVEVVAV